MLPLPFVGEGRNEGARTHSPSPSSPPVEGGETRGLFLRRGFSPAAISPFDFSSFRRIDWTDRIDLLSIDEID